MFRFLDRWNGSLRQLHQAAFTPVRPADADRMMVLLEQRDIELENYLDTELFRRPRGIVGNVSTGSSDTGHDTTYSDIASLTFDLAVVAGRNYKIEATVNFRKRTSSGVVYIAVAVDGTVLNSEIGSWATDEYGTLTTPALYTPTVSGTVTVTAQAKVSGGTVDVNPLGAADSYSLLIAYDEGAL